MRPSRNQRATGCLVRAAHGTAPAASFGLYASAPYCQVPRAGLRATATVTLPAGVQTLTLAQDHSGGKLNYLTFS